MNRRQCRVFRVLQVAVSSALLSVPAAADAQGNKWEVEVHGGGAFVSNLSGGTTTLPSSTALATPDPQLPSRRVSTWFAGAGSTLANDVAARFTGADQFAARITPLDGVLNRPFAERDNGGGFGFRVSRSLTPRFAAEFNFDYAATSLGVPSAVSSGIATTTTTVKSTFEGLLAPLPPFLRPLTVTSSSDVDDAGGGSQLLATGALNINLRTSGKVIPYATVGAGVVSDRGDAPSAELQAQYLVRFQTTTIIEETDSVTLAYDADTSGFVGVLGGGAKLLLSPRAGIRVDARVHLGSRTVRTLMDTNPAVRVVPPPFNTVFWSITNPSIIFSNNPTLTDFASSLSGAALDEFEAYKVDGSVRQVLLSVGYFFGF